MSNKKQLISIIFYTLCVLFWISVVVITLVLVIWWKDTEMPNVNLFSQTRFETKNFIIDLSNSSWIGQDREIGAVFVGATTTVKGIEGEVYLLMAMYRNVSYKTIKRFEETSCDQYFKKSVQKIGDWEAEVYDCTTSTRKDLMHRYIAYKDESLFMSYYIDDIEAFQPRYDEFFKRIKLK